MMKSNKSIYLLLLVMGSLFWFRFDILQFILSRAQENKVIRTYAPQYLPDLSLKFFNLFKESDKNLLIGSSVFHTYLNMPQYYQDSFSQNNEYYARLGNSYLQIINEITLIRRKSVKNIVFFLQPGEIGIPIEKTSSSWLTQPISNQELVSHFEILKQVCIQNTIHLYRSIFLFKNIFYEYLLNRSKGDSFLFSIFQANLSRVQTLPNIRLRNYFLLKSPPINPIIPYSEALFQFNPEIHIALQYSESFDINFEYMSQYLKDLLADRTVTFVELSYAQRCEDKASLETRALFLNLMKNLNERLSSSKFKFIPREDLPVPQDFLFKDCIHLSSEPMTVEKYNFLKLYFEALSKKLSMPDLNI